MIRLRSAPWLAILCALLIGTLTWITFQDVIEHPFLHWDDDHYIVENPAIRHLGLVELRWMFLGVHLGHYHPLTWLSYSLDYQIGGLSPNAYHRTNLLLHLFNGLLVALLCCQVRRHFDETTPSTIWILAVALSTPFFLIHPLRAESVAWVSNRKDLLATLFALASASTYLAALASTRSINWKLVSGVFFLGSVLSKATALGLPMILIAFEWMIIKSPLQSNLIEWRSRRSLRRLIAENSIHLAAMVIAMILAPLAQSEAGATVAVAAHPLSARVLQACYSLVYYPLRTLWPTDLACLYLLPAAIDLSQPRFAAAAAVVIGAIVLLSRVQVKWMIFSLASYTILILPVSGLAQAGMQLVADRYSYLPAAFLAIASSIPIARLAARLQRFASIRAMPERLLIPAGASLGVLFLLAALQRETVRQLGSWASDAKLWANALHVDPNNYIAWNNWGSERLRDGASDEAYEAFLHAVTLCPDYAIAQVNAGAMEIARGEIELGRSRYQRALEAAPNHADAHYNLANLLAREGNQEAALAHYARAADARPRDFRIRANRARMLLLTKQYDECIDEYRVAIEIDPDSPIGWQGLAASLRAAGDDEGALRAFDRARQLGVPFRAENEPAARVADQRIDALTR